MTEIKEKKKKRKKIKYHTSPGIFDRGVHSRNILTKEYEYKYKYINIHIKIYRYKNTSGINGVEKSSNESMIVIIAIIALIIATVQRLADYMRETNVKCYLK